MEHYFIWNGVSSREKGIWVLSYPPITKPPQRVQQVTIPGRPGALTLLEGDDVYDQYIRETKIMPKPGADIGDIIAWLSGAGTVIFGHQPSKAQTAYIFDELDFVHEFATQRSGTVMFLCDPFKSDIFEQQSYDVDVTEESFALTGKGDVKAYPMLTATVTGTSSITINGVELAMEDLSGETAHIDCSSCITWIEQEDENENITKVPVTTHGDYFSLKPHGANIITWSEGISALTIYPEWRWL